VEKSATFVIYQDIDRTYRWSLRSSEGSRIASSKSGHRKKSECAKEMEHLRLQWPNVLVRDATLWSSDKQPFSQWLALQRN
jgi:uncharacterized protein YegP (UPF0339 family)